MAYGSRFIEDDIALVIEELQEEQDEAERLKAADAADIPVLQVRNLDFSYGKCRCCSTSASKCAKGSRWPYWALTGRASPRC